MSSGSSGRYQSRLFNFVHQQSRRFTDQCERTFRHLQVATKWGAEVLIYPVYQLFNSAESAGKQLGSSVQEHWLQLQPTDTDFQPPTPPSADTPIQRILQAVDTLPSDEEEQPNAHLETKTEPRNFWEFLASSLGETLRGRRFKSFNSNSPSKPNLSHSSAITKTPPASLSRTQQNVLRQNRPVVRGIATQLAARTLVLVTAQNEILDILTPQQQQKLQERIIGEVANYWRYWRLAAGRSTQQQLPSNHRPLTKRISGNRAKIPPLLPGIAQQSQGVRDEEIQPTSLLNPYPVLAFLDTVVADLESNALVPVSEATNTLQKRSWQLIRVVQTQLSVFLSGKVQPNVNGQGAVAVDSSETQTLRIQGLIWAAINYFFGESSRTKLEQTTPTLQLNVGSKPQGKKLPHRPITSLLPSRKFSGEDLLDPWLTEGDLFGDSQEESLVTTSPTSNPALPANESAGYSLQNLINRLRKFSPQPKQATGLVQQKKPNRSITRTEKTSGKVAQASKVTASRLSPPKGEKGEISQQHSRTTEIDHQPDWIETKARTVGYIKHPLEQILEWLDRTMLWLEEVIAKIWQSLQWLWRGK